jgi:hypothetical protein
VSEIIEAPSSVPLGPGGNSAQGHVEKTEKCRARKL